VIVVDTNLLIDYYIERGRTAMAETVLDRDPLWMAPLLWRSEFRNVLADLIADGIIQLADAVRATHDAELLMGGHEYQVLSESVLRLATGSGCTAYDCEFVALAQDLGTRLVTSDAELLKAFPGLTVTPERFVRR
jgi:predicted nucleic acid-binding protein